MDKSDQSLKNTCIAAIKRSTIPPFDFSYTRIYKAGDTIDNEKIKTELIVESEERLICSTIINDKIWTILTTRRIISFEGVGLQQHSIKSIQEWNAGDFKGYSGQNYTKGFLHFTDGKIFPFFIETGRASMVMIYGIRTLSGF